jgi:hypothetical protein
VSDLAEQNVSSGPLSVHGDIGTVWTVARNVQGTNMPQERRTFSDWNNTALAIFDWKDSNGVQDASNDCHTSLAADNEDWVMEGCYDDPNYNTPGNPNETGAFEDEVIQISMDGSQRIRRLLHHRSYVTNTTATNGYWAMPKPTISRDGRFIAFTSNWEDSVGRYDLFIAKIEPPNQSSPSTPVDVTWTNLVNASASGNNLTATAENGRGETTQSIVSGNGSISGTVTYTSQPPGLMRFGLINGTFTGDPTEIDYGWKYYDNGVAYPCINNVAQTNYIVAANNETLEVRINGTTIEWYRGSSSTPVYSISGQSLSYPYRGVAMLSASSNRILDVRMTGTH